MRLIIVLLLSGFLASCSNDKKSERRATKAKQKADGVITTKHVQVPLSALYVIPPSGFTPDSVTKYLQTHGQTNGIQSYFYMIGLNSETAGEKKMAELKTESEQKYPGVWKEEAINASGSHPAKIYRYQIYFDQVGYGLFFTDDFSRQMLGAMHSTGNEAVGKEMYEAMKTLVVKTDTN